MSEPVEDKGVEAPQDPRNLKVLQCKTLFTVAALNEEGEVIETTIVEGLFPEAVLKETNLGELAGRILSGDIQPRTGGPK